MHQGQSRLHNGPIDPLEKFDRVLQVISGFDSVHTEDHIPVVSHTSHPIYLLIKKALRYKNQKKVDEGNGIVSKQSTIDQALANYLIFKSRNEHLAGSYIKALKLVLLMREFLNKSGLLFINTDAIKDPFSLAHDFTEV